MNRFVSFLLLSSLAFPTLSLAQFDPTAKKDQEMYEKERAWPADSAKHVEHYKSFCDCDAQILAEVAKIFPEAIQGTVTIQGKKLRLKCSYSDPEKNDPEELFPNAKAQSINVYSQRLVEAIRSWDRFLEQQLPEKVRNFSNKIEAIVIEPYDIDLTEANPEELEYWDIKQGEYTKAISLHRFAFWGEVTIVEGKKELWSKKDGHLPSGIDNERREEIFLDESKNDLYFERAVVDLWKKIFEPFVNDYQVTGLDSYLEEMQKFHDMEKRFGVIK